MVRPPCCDKLNVKRGLWTAEEDAKILAYVSNHGTGNWTDVPKKAGLRRCGKSCRLRWTNYLRPDLKHDNFTPQEEEMIVRLHAAIGSRWSIIAQQLPGRTDNDVKNYWNSKLKKKLTEMGIDPVTHKPFSQILADYGNIGGFPKPTRIGSLNRDLKNAFLFKSQSQQHPQGHRFIIQATKNDDNNNSMELLAQLQSIKLVTEPNVNNNNNNNTMSHVFGEGSSFSCSSSTSSTCSSNVGQEPTTTFSWRDFLLEDPFVPVDGPQEEEHLLGQCENVEVDWGVLTSPTSNGSFVETMLDQDNQMMPEFPQLLDEPFYY